MGEPAPLIGERRLQVTDLALNVYHRLPNALRSLVATGRGYQLRRWRYGPETDTLVAEALSREQWSEERWRAWREERLAYLLHRAATRVPFYREQWAARRARGDRSSWEEISNWPLLDKEELRSHPRCFVADDQDIRAMFHEHTSGTSGKPLDLWWSRQTARAWYALSEARVRHWNGVNRRERWAIVGGQAVVPPSAKKPPYWVWNAAMKQLYISANHVSAGTVPAMMESLRRYRITHVLGYPSSLTAIARGIAGNIALPELRVVITNAEPVHSWQRDLIQSTFGSRVVETYGMGEIVAAGSECSAGRLHLWPEVGMVEVVDDQTPDALDPGATGRLVCTGLLNHDMPLIRYLVGDRGSLAERDEPCACGRRLPTFSNLEGRSADMLFAPDGRRVFWLNPVFYELPIREAQIVQERLRHVRVRYVPAPGFSEAEGKLVIGRIRARMGDVDVELEAVEEIPRGPNGKFRPVVCHVTEPGSMSR